ncbi:MAG: PD-(D/E)XK nuclease family protein [Bacteroidales bacterium]|nr:PD-(D/E)XK nuclease family protein [Bacteroidales bacterium]
MNSFLYQVARHYLEAGIQDKCFVFPNRRSIVFFTKHLRTLVASGAGEGRPVIMPRMLTVADFYGTLYGAPVADKVTLLLELYDVYKTLYKNAEPLDDFIFWGDVILSDFSDTDKYLADPKQLFTNVSDFKAIQDSYEYLSDEQIAAVESFLNHFKNDSKPFKDKFLGLWNILLPLYEGFWKVLREKNLAYDGMVYRSVAGSFKEGSAADITAEKFPGAQQFVFVGLNALNECERLVMKRLRDARLASFCWDYCGEMIKDKSNRSSFFMDRNVAEFPMDWKLEELPGIPQVNVVGVPSMAGQAKLLSQMITAPEDTAVVLPDENLLLPVLNSIPDSIEKVNVTMGMPLSGSRIHALMHEVAMLQLQLRQSGGQWFFYHKYVWNILSGGIMKQILPAEDWEKVLDIKKAAKYYIPEADFAGCGDLVRTIFRPVVKEPKVASDQNVKALQAYLGEVLDAVTTLFEADEDLSAELEFAKRWKDCIRALKNKTLDILPVTYIRLLGQLAMVQSVPLEGEPLGGLQIMGPLETRALDFGTVILLSCNDGVFPRHTVSSSFVPPQLRKAFGLPTYEYQDSVWAYYFYRMICRAGTVWLLYDTRTESGRTGDESRYIKQLRYHFRLPVKTMVARSDVSFADSVPPIEKPADIEAILKSKKLSASSLQNYLSCPAKFYYSKILALKPEEEVAETLDAGMLGNVFHETMQGLYKTPDGVLTERYLTSCLKDKDRLRETIGLHIKEQIHSLEVTGKNLILQDVILQYVLKTLETDLGLVRERGEIRILGLELERFWQFDGFSFTGIIDRLDAFRDGTTRVVDYKTGKVQDNDVAITDDNASAVADLLFGEDNSRRPKIALQLFLYDMFVDENLTHGRLVNCIYPAPKLFSSGIEEAPVSHEFCKIMKERLGCLLKEIASPEVPFTRTEDRGTCAICDFKNICGR